MSKNKKPKAAKKEAPKSGLVTKASAFGGGSAKPTGMIPSNSSFSSAKKGGAQNNAPRKAQ